MSNEIDADQMRLIRAWAECKADLEVGEFNFPKDKRLDRIEQLVNLRLAELAKDKEPCGDSSDAEPNSPSVSTPCDSTT